MSPPPGLKLALPMTLLAATAVVFPFTVKNGKVQSGNPSEYQSS